MFVDGTSFQFNALKDTNLFAKTGYAPIGDMNITLTTESRGLYFSSLYPIGEGYIGSNGERVKAVYADNLVGTLSGFVNGDDTTRTNTTAKVWGAVAN